MRGSLEGKSLFFNKKGQSGFEKSIMAVIIFLLFIGMSVLFLSDDFVAYFDSVPLYFYPFLIFGIGMGVAYLIRR